MKSFINDSTIIKKFIDVTIRRTNLYDIPSVIKIFDILHSFFQEYDMSRSISSFPYKVDYILLWKAINIILDSEQYMCISKVIWFFYHNSHLMNLEALYKMLNSIFNDKFYKLFFHWSYQVRNTFYYFLLFIIEHKLKLYFDIFFVFNRDNYLANQKENYLKDLLIEKNSYGFMSAVKKDIS